MVDKRNASSATGDKHSRKSARRNPEQRSRRLQTMMFGLLALIMIISMVISLVAH